MIERILGDDVDDTGKYLAEVVYGANDGIVTTFAVVAGVAGAALNPSIVLVLGAANLFADGFSMGMSNYLSRRSEMDYQRSARKGGSGPVGHPDGKSPRRTAFVTFAGFVVAGWAPCSRTCSGSPPRSGSRSCSPDWRSSAWARAGAS